MKKFIIMGVLLLVIALSLFRCGSGREKIYILNWDEYISEELIEDFEEAYNCKVILEIAESNEIMYAQIERNYAPYDIAFPSDYMVDQLQQDGMLKEIDFTKLTNYDEAYFDSTLMELINKYCVNNKNYLVPYFWGSLGIMYNTNVLSEAEIARIEEDGWKVLFDNDFSSSMGMYASSRDSIAAALMSNGYSVNSTDPVALAQAEESLKKMKYKGWATDDLKVGVASGKYSCALVYSGDFFDILYSAMDSEEEINFDIFCPKDINNVFFDAMVIPNTSKNEELAYKFIDFMLDYDNSLTNAQYVGYCPTLTSVYQGMTEDEDYVDVTVLDAYYPGDILNGEIYQYLGADVYRQYEEIYKRVKK